jgi:hypothetical protein
MHLMKKKSKILLAASILLLSSCAMMEHGDRLSGANEVPPNSSSATGRSNLAIAADKSVSGSVTYSGMTATAAHIHMGAPGANGPVIVPFTKTAEGTFIAPPNARLTDEQYAAYRAGNLYFNIHSAAHPGGEIRAQLAPK